MMLKFTDWLKGREKAIFPDPLTFLGMMNISLFPPTDYELEKLREKLSVQPSRSSRPRLSRQR